MQGITTHIISIVLTFLLTVGLILYFSRHLKKVDPEKPHNNVRVTLAEQIIFSFNSLMENITNKRMQATYPYIFTLLLFILSGNVVGLFGFVNQSASLSFTFAIGLVTFIGIFVVGITARGLWNFIKNKYANPLEILTQFGPLISISIRLFGANFGFAFLIAIIHQLVGGIFQSIPFLANFNILQPFYGWALLGVDFFLSGLQAFVFSVLTMIYWNQEYITKEERIEIKRLRNLKRKRK